MLRKRPCCICRRWFTIDRRVGRRQRACSSPACQRARREGTQASWRRRNLDYFHARRLHDRQLAAATGECGHGRRRRCAGTGEPRACGRDPARGARPGEPRRRRRTRPATRTARRCRPCRPSANARSSASSSAPQEAPGTASALPSSHRIQHKAVRAGSAAKSTPA